MTYSAMTPEHKICAVADAVVHLRTLRFITRRVTKRVDAGSNLMPGHSVHATAAAHCILHAAKPVVLLVLRDRAGQGRRGPCDQCSPP